MPILKKESDQYPDNLFDDEALLARTDLDWHCLYTISRREKDLMRRLHVKQIAFYAPVITKRYRSPNGRLRTSYIPLLPNYVFMLGSEGDRYEAMTTNCISRHQIVEDRKQLVSDLRNIHLAISTGSPLTPEARLEAGQAVRVRSGPFKDYEGQVIRREGKTRLLLTIQFLEQCVSMEMDEALLVPV